MEIGVQYIQRFETVDRAFQTRCLFRIGCHGARDERERERRERERRERERERETRDERDETRLHEIDCEQWIPPRASLQSDTELSSNVTFKKV